MKILFSILLEDKCRKDRWAPIINIAHRDTYLPEYCAVVANFQNESCGKSFMTSAAVICNIYYDLIMEFQDILEEYVLCHNKTFASNLQKMHEITVHQLFPLL